MKRRVKDDYCTMRDIAEAWMKEEQIEVGISSIRNKFKYILKKCNFEETPFRNDPFGSFIFNKDDAPNNMKKLFEVFDKKSGSKMKQEWRRELSGILCNLLPSDKVLVESKKVEISAEKMIKHFQNEIYVSIEVKNNKPRKKIRKEVYCFQYQLIKKWHDKMIKIMDLAGVGRAYSRICNGKELGIQEFMPKEEDRKEFYRKGKSLDFQFKDIYIKTRRMSTDELYKICLSLYEKENKINENREEDEYERKDKGAWYEVYEELVRSVLMHSLRNISKVDYNYIIRNAFEELIEISSKVKDDLEYRKNMDELERRKQEEEEYMANNLKYLNKEARGIIDKDKIKVNSEENEEMGKAIIDFYFQKDWNTIFDMAPDDHPAKIGFYKQLPM